MTKTVAALLGAIAVLTADAVLASPPLNDGQANETNNATAARALKAMEACSPPPTAVAKWSYLLRSALWTKTISMKTCDTKYEDSGRAWNMLNAYRSGGMEYVNWRHVEKKDDFSDCLKDWTYYGKDGKWVIAKVEGYTTTIGDKDKKPWCPLAVYQPDGKRGYQWDYCECVLDV